MAWRSDVPCSGVRSAKVQHSSDRSAECGNGNVKICLVTISHGMVQSRSVTQRKGQEKIPALFFLFTNLLKDN